MKFKKFSKVICYFIIFIMLIGSMVGADIPDFKVITDKKPIDKVQYDGYDFNVSRLRIQGSDNVIYCLEITKKYPSGQVFSSIGNLSKNIENVVAAGYPNRSFRALNLDNEDEAYFATQIAIWSAMQGYDVNKFKGSNPKILDAIRNIYNDGMSGKYANKIRTKAYKTNDESIQEIITVLLDDLSAEQKAESKQKEFPPQEG
ncbi:Cys-Gln thioester bond-forming surface protein [Clostridium sp.]|jgi:TQXA domain-containing protein|uniref:Cys-Gln thioester bond-forming surface protein n=1 Tax=Clostridium sp. TaxID=1506 RepID=UPI00283D33EB|nr:Cys-Gln thioester bond-forming surface protein [Clostridium sp.]MDR3596762.1 Cys-Gln thioester bond-forming surface protein [Clostridium sp.]